MAGCGHNAVRQGQILRPFKWVIVVMTGFLVAGLCAAALGEYVLALLGVLCVIATALGWALGVIVASRGSAGCACADEAAERAVGAALSTTLEEMRKP